MMGTVLVHQLNQPLSVIKLTAQQVARAITKLNAPPEIINKLQTIDTELERVSKTIRESVRQAKNESHDTQAPITLKSVIDNTVAIMQSKANEVGILLTVSCSEEAVHAQVLANQLELEELCFLLLQNTLNAASKVANPQLSIILEKQEFTLSIIFIDTCGGIPEQIITNLNAGKPSPMSSASGGLGLGLSIAQFIVIGLSGSMNIQVHNESGTKICISLPLHINSAKNN